MQLFILFSTAITDTAIVGKGRNIICKSLLSQIRCHIKMFTKKQLKCFASVSLRSLKSHVTSYLRQTLMSNLFHCFSLISFEMNDVSSLPTLSKYISVVFHFGLLQSNSNQQCLNIIPGSHSNTLIAEN